MVEGGFEVEDGIERIGVGVDGGVRVAEQGRGWMGE